MTSAKLKSMLAKKAKVAAAAKNLAKGRAVDKAKPGVGSGLLHSGGDDEEAGSEDDDEAGAIGILDDLGAVLRGAKVLRSLKSIKTTLAKLPDDDQNRSERKDLLIKQASVLGATALQLSKIPAMPWPEILKNADSLDNAGFESSKLPIEHKQHLTCRRATIYGNEHRYQEWARALMLRLKIRPGKWSLEDEHCLFSGCLPEIVDGDAQPANKYKAFSERYFYALFGESFLRNMKAAGEDVCKNVDWRNFEDVRWQKCSLVKMAKAFLGTLLEETSMDHENESDATLMAHAQWLKDCATKTFQGLLIMECPIPRTLYVSLEALNWLFPSSGKASASSLIPKCGRMIVSDLRDDNGPWKERKKLVEAKYANECKFSKPIRELTALFVHCDVSYSRTIPALSLRVDY